MPSINEGIRSKKEYPFGLKAKYVTNLNRVKMTRKIKKRLITHKTVLGNLYFTSMIMVQNTMENGIQKNIIYPVLAKGCC